MQNLMDSACCRIIPFRQWWMIAGDSRWRGSNHASLSSGIYGPVWANILIQRPLDRGEGAYFHTQPRGFRTSSEQPHDINEILQRTWFIRVLGLFGFLFEPQLNLIWTFIWVNCQFTANLMVPLTWNIFEADKQRREVQTIISSQILAFTLNLKAVEC